ncbi:MAG: dTDP-glucose 4,6-dehydratase [Planctomycetaceae bacterium]|nr:dTDP-glucose 4,6-dehydratase [Planctomycetaceae bacterium]
MSPLVVTGGAGFIGSHFIRLVLKTAPDVEIINFDALTYSGNLANVADVSENPRYTFVRGDITNPTAVRTVMQTYRPKAIVNFAAQNHVDRSILSAHDFIHSNIVGVQVLLEAVREFGLKRFLQVSTDEVYGTLAEGDPTFTEESLIEPNSPYSASKAAADLIVRSYVKTHGTPAVITRCSNNYGPNQFPEAFIPLFITNALEDIPCPLYGDGKYIRDWVHVRDHCHGIWLALLQGRVGEIYNLGGANEWLNTDIANKLMDLCGKPRSLLMHVKDRPAHDRRYGINFSKATRELGWKPETDFEQGLKDTVEWYRTNRNWWRVLKKATSAKA